MSEAFLRAVDDYLSRGWTLVPVHFKSKMPVAKAWQEPLKPDAVRHAFASTALNVAVHLGVHSQWLVDIDLDCPEALSLAPTFLLPTATFGRRSNPQSHWLYTVSNPIDTKKFKDPTRKGDEAMIAEIRSNNHYTVFPPSFHDSGEAIDWTDPSVPVTVLPADQLRRAVARLSACVIVCRSWPTGARHEASMALAGGLSRCGLTDEEVLSFLDAVCTFTDDDEKPDRLRAARDTLKKLHAGRKKVSGFPALAEVMGEDPVEAVRSFLVDGDDGTILEDFNKDFRFIFAKGQVIIAQIADDPDTGKKTVNYMSTATLKEALASRYITIGKGDAIKTVKLANYWLNTPGVKTEYTGITFRPTGRVPDGVFNTWRGFSVEPNPSGDWSLFRQHVLENVANNDLAHYDWIMAFLADAFQRPEVKPAVALILQGEQGTGKTNFAEVVRSLVEEHSTSVSSAHHLVGKFNAHLQDCLFLIANEAFYAGDKQHESVIKALVSDKTTQIERKGKDPIELPSYIRLIMTSNANWIVPKARDDRRWAAFRVGNGWRNKRDKFSAMFAQLNDGGREGLLHHLLNLDYDRDFAVKIPETEATIQQREMSLSPIEQWWEERLNECNPCPTAGAWARRGRNGVDTWPEMVAKPALYEDFRSTFGRSVRYERESVFWNEFYRLLPDESKGRGMLCRVNRPMFSQAEGHTVNSTRVAFMKLPCHDDARRQYAQLSNRTIDWAEVTPDEPPKQEEY